MEEKFIKLSSLFEYLDSREDYWRERVKPHMENMEDKEYGKFHEQCVKEDAMALGEVKEFIEAINHFAQYTKTQLLENEK